MASLRNSKVLSLLIMGVAITFAAYGRIWFDLTPITNNGATPHKDQRKNMGVMANNDVVFNDGIGANPAMISDTNAFADHHMRLDDHIFSDFSRRGDDRRRMPGH